MTLDVTHLRFRRASEPANTAIAFADPREPRLSGRLLRAEYIKSLLAADLRAGVVDVGKHPAWVRDVMRSWLKPKWRAL